ncbi:MAG: hypothetical protein M0D53_11625 [Flavobacterium sp. JAD_PAG50586_2]|nr:MAG: hypothetical protein M0D53_11625 [Flavobacterium sp. JAD_PAG50586_2]
MLHEFGHAIFNQLGYRWATHLKYKETISYNGSEVFAFGYAYKYGGVNSYDGMNILDNGHYLTAIQVLGDLIKTDARFTNY